MFSMYDDRTKDPTQMKEIGDESNVSEYIETKLANVDFYSVTVYYSIGIPTRLFTAIFSIARVSGWVPQVIEQLEDNSIYRPLTRYTGPKVPIPVPPLDMR